MALDSGYWESPIHINTQHHIQEINKAVEGEIMKAVMKVGVDVDKERLLKALMDAKSFYEEGYADGKRNSVVYSFWEEYDTSSFGGYKDGEAVWWKRKFFRCERCRKATAVKTPYCPYCGAKMED